MPLQNSLEQLMKRQNLDRTTIQEALHAMLDSDANPAQTAAFLALLRSKGETADELASMIAYLQQSMVPLSTHHKVLDIVGTGGDGAHTVNISTGSAILAASCGIKIVKHGNRAVSSLAGSADVLEALGLIIDLSPEKICANIDNVGIGFCFGPNFHPALRQLRTIRKQLHIPTSFNLLGALLNPARPSHHLLGVFDESLLLPVAHALKQMGTDRSLIVYGYGLDELSCIGPAKLIEVTQAYVKEYILDPKQFGLARCTITDLRGGDAKTNAQLLLTVFSPKSAKKHQAIGDTLILNAAVALYLYGLHSSIADAIEHARDNLLNGSALTLLNNWIECSHD